MEEVKNNQGSGLAVGALVTAIIAFLMAVIPCVGVVAMVPAVIAVILAIIGLSRSNRNQGMLIGGLVVAVISLMISISQIVVIGKIADKSGSWSDDIESVIKDVTDDIEKEFGSNDVTIRIKSGTDSLEIKATTHREDLKSKLEELEGGADTTGADTLK